MEDLRRKSILDMTNGAIKERVDYEMSKVIDNILDPNTAAAKKRTLTVTLEITPDSERQRMTVKTVAKSKLEPTNPILTSLYITGNDNGEVTAVEMVPQIPGQQSVLGAEQEEPSALRLIKGA